MIAAIGPNLGILERPLDGLVTMSAGERGVIYTFNFAHLGSRKLLRFRGPALHQELRLVPPQGCPLVPISFARPHEKSAHIVQRPLISGVLSN